MIHLEDLQIKSKEKFKILCQCLDTMEKEFGIMSVKISVSDVFCCPDINLLEFVNSDDPMEKLVGGLFVKLDIKRHGKNSVYKKA